MKPSDVLKNRQVIREAAKRLNAANPRVFGSVARGEDRPASDIDILVDALPGSTPFSLGGLQYELQQIFGGVRVDLLTPGDLPEMVRDRVLAEATPLRPRGGGFISIRCTRRRPTCVSSQRTWIARPSSEISWFNELPG